MGTTAENIWMGIRGELVEVPELARDIMDGLMGSEGHRRNILAEGITHIGIGIYSSAGRAFMSTEITATQLFAKVQGYTLEPVPEVLRWGVPSGFDSRGRKTAEPPPVTSTCGARNGRGWHSVRFP